MAKHDNPPKTLQTATKPEIETLIRDTEIVFPGDLFGGDSINQSLNSPHTSYDGRFFWSSNKDFLEYITNITDTDSVRDANRVLYQTVTKAPEYSAPTDTPIEKVNEVTSSLPDAGTRETQESQQEIYEKGVEKADVKAKVQVDQFIKNAEAVAKRKQAFEALKAHKIKVAAVGEVPKVKLANEDKKVIFELNKSIKIDGGGTLKVAIKEGIKKTLKDSPPEVSILVTDPTIEKFSNKVVSIAATYSNKVDSSGIATEIPIPHPSSPLVAISDPNNVNFQKFVPNKEAREILAENARELALAIDAEQRVNRTFGQTFLPKNVVDAFFGSDEELGEFQIAGDQSENNQDSIELDFDNIVKGGSDVYEKLNKFASGSINTEEIGTQTLTYIPNYNVISISSPEAAKTAQETSLIIKAALPSKFGSIYGFRQGSLAMAWAKNRALLLSSSSAPLLTGEVGTLMAASNAVSYQLIFDASIGKFSMQVITATNGPLSMTTVGTSLGNKVYGLYFGTSPAGFGVGKITGTVGGKIGTKAILPGLTSKISGLIAKATTLLGAWTGPVALGIGYLVGKIAEKINWGKVFKFAKQFSLTIASIPIIGAGLLFGIPGMFIGGAVLGGIGLGIGSGVTASGFGAGMMSFFQTLGSAIFLSIGKPIFVILIVFPIIISLILFIINSGAYLVPPSISTLTTLGQVISPYIDVKKTASPKVEFENSELPVTIEYTIEITAKKGALTNIILQDECTVRKKDGSAICPPRDPAIPQPGSADYPLAISPGTPYIFKYSMTFPSLTFTDSRISNSIKVIADAVEQSGATAAGAASIKIGDPPEDCPADWPVYPEGEPNLVIYQGSHTSGGTHDEIEAIDIFSPDEPLNTAIIGNLVKATHQGVVAIGEGGNYGRYVDVTSMCTKTDGKEVQVTSRYAHLSGISGSLVNGQNIGKDYVVGLAGSSGTAYPHLHYEFRPAPGPIPMDPPYLPKPIPDGCFNAGGKPCNVTY